MKTIRKISDVLALMMIITMLQWVMACSQNQPLVAKTATPEQVKSNIEKDYPIQGPYDPTQKGTVIPETVVDQKTQEVQTVNVERVKEYKGISEDRAKAHMDDTIARMKNDHAKGFLTKGELVQQYTDEYIEWVQNQNKNVNVKDWLWEKAKEAFQYDQQIIHLKQSLPIVFGKVLCDGSDKDSYSEAMGYVLAVTVEVIGIVICLSTEAAPVATLICGPTGYIIGAGLGEFVVGPIVYDLRCKQ